MKNDLWRILDNQRIEPINFKKVVLDEFMGCKTINLLTIKLIAMEMEREYNYVLSYIYDSLEHIYNDGIITLEKKAISLLCKRMNQIINEIETIKNEGFKEIRPLY